MREGYDTAAKQRVRARDQIQTLIGGENSDGHEIAAYTATYIGKWGQREGWFQAAVQVDPTSMAYATAAVLAENETEVLSWTFTIVPNLPGKTVFDNFDVGDWLGIERPDFSAVDTVRVTAIAVAVDSAGTESHELTFVSYMQWLADQLQYISNKLGGTFVNSQGTSPVAPSKYGTGQVPTYFTPAATLQGLSDVATNSAASTQTNAPLVYNSATGQYQAAGSTDPVTGQTVSATVASAAGTTTVSDTAVTVVTGSGTTTIGLQGDGSVTTVDTGAAAPPAPDAPAASGLVQALQVTWDGLLAGAKPPSNFTLVQVYVGSSSGFVPSSANMVGTLTAAGSLTISGLTGGSTYYVKLAAVNSSGAVSPATAAVPATVQQMPTAALTGQMPASLIGNTAGSALNPNAYFNGGSLAGWTVANGFVSAGAPPAGAPGGAQYAALVTATAANCLLTGVSAPFPVTPGQPYAMTAWVYNPGSSSITVAAGFGWASGTATVTVGPGTWVPVTAVETCPAGVTSAYQVIGPVASGSALWVLGAVAAGQVPGSLIAANSVAANQIAAQAITAAQIAANTITASQIAANTVTAAQIAASTITAAQIAANTITASQVAANTLTATQIAAGTVIAGAVNGTIITGATFVATGTSGEFLAYSGTPAYGNLIMSFAAAAGSDSYSNSYSAGFWVYGANGSAVGMVPAGSNTALSLAPSSGTTPTAVAGQTLVYGSSSGTMQVVDGVDGQTYGTARRSLVLGSAANITSTSWGTFFQSAMAANASQRSYRVRGQLICVAGGSTGTFNFMWLEPSGGGGLISFTWFEGSSSWTAGVVTAGTRAAAVPTMSNGSNYLCFIEGVVTVPAGTSGQFQLQAAQNGSSWQVAATSVIDIEPVLGDLHGKRLPCPGKRLRAEPAQLPGHAAFSCHAAGCGHAVRRGRDYPAGLQRARAGHGLLFHDPGRVRRLRPGPGRSRADGGGRRRPASTGRHVRDDRGGPGSWRADRAGLDIRQQVGRDRLHDRRHYPLRPGRLSRDWRDRLVDLGVPVGLPVLVVCQHGLHALLHGPGQHLEAVHLGAGLRGGRLDDPQPLGPAPLVGLAHYLPSLRLGVELHLLSVMLCLGCDAASLSARVAQRLLCCSLRLGEHRDCVLAGQRARLGGTCGADLPAQPADLGCQLCLACASLRQCPLQPAQPDGHLRPQLVHAFAVIAAEGNRKVPFQQVRGV